MARLQLYIALADEKFPHCVLCLWFCACIKALGPKSMTQRRIEEPACQADCVDETSAKQTFCICRMCGHCFFVGQLSPRHQDRVIERILQLGCLRLQLLQSLRQLEALKFLLIQLHCLRQENANARDKKGHLQVLGFVRGREFQFSTCFCSRRSCTVGS